MRTANAAAALAILAIGCDGPLQAAEVGRLVGDPWRKPTNRNGTAERRAKRKAERLARKASRR